MAAAEENLREGSVEEKEKQQAGGVRRSGEALKAELGRALPVVGRRSRRGGGSVEGTETEEKEEGPVEEK